MYIFCFLLLAWCSQVWLAAGTSHERNPVRLYETVNRPLIHTTDHAIGADSSFEISFELSNRKLKLSLEPNEDIISEGATILHLTPDGRTVKSEPIDRLAHKVFKGTVHELSNSGHWRQAGPARIVVHQDGAKALFEGFFTLDSDHHHIQTSKNYVATKHFMDPELELGDEEFMVCVRDSDIADYSQPGLLQGGYSLDDMISRQYSTKRQDDSQNPNNMADLRSTIGQTNGCPLMKRVALVGVAADCSYMAGFDSPEAVRRNIITQMNSASALFERTFNITLGLRNLTLVDASCPESASSSMPWNQACSSNVDISTRLTLFGRWRAAQRDGNSHWTLLSNCRTGSTIGIAWMGQICSQGGANVVARTQNEWQVIAHETGHTFGAVHDCTSQTCGDGTAESQQCCPLSRDTCDAQQQYIMNPAANTGIQDFSPCSIGSICASIGRNRIDTDCLTDNRNVNTITGQQCGNGIVEEGEDCDCGGEEACRNNSCCDPSTCRFREGAVCDDSNEDCCTNCQFASSSTVCRPSAGDCDLEERCTGDTPNCPSDSHLANGTSCGNGLYCASGQCTSRDLQCRNATSRFASNDARICDDDTCMLTCTSSNFRSGRCYSLQQNLLDGTECGDGGRCSNGICSTSSGDGGQDNPDQQGRSWIDNNRNVVIGVAAGVGGLVLLLILGCIYSCIRLRLKRRNTPRPAAVPAMTNRLHPGSAEVPMVPPSAWRGTRYM